MASSSRTLPDLLDGIRVGMLVLHEHDGLGGRPLTIQRVEADAVWFVVGHDNPWLPSDGALANATFVGDKLWVSLTGTMSTSIDPARLADLGDPVSDAWFQEGHDPVALRLEVDSGDWWTAPGFLTSAVELAKAKVTRSEPDLGERGAVAP